MYPPANSISLAVSRDPSSLDECAEAPSRMDEVAFQTLYEHSAKNLRAYIRKVSGDASLADDILQESFYRFLRADLPAMETVQAKSYLYRIANTLLADHWRQLKRERRWSLKNFFGTDVAADEEPGSEAMNVFRLLKPQEQNLLWLAYVEGFNHQEVATALGLSEKSVRVLLFRARKKLAGFLRKQGLGPEVQPWNK